MDKGTSDLLTVILSLLFLTCAIIGAIWIVSNLLHQWGVC